MNTRLTHKSEKKSLSLGIFAEEITLDRVFQFVCLSSLLVYKRDL